jgi:catechol 2,3-dioxygenase
MNTDIAQLVSVALYSPRPDESVAFFHDMLGMEISHREGQSVYMRAYEDFYQYTLKVTESKRAGLEEVTWRASSLEALDKVTRQIEASGLGTGWTEKDYAHSRAYKFTSPDGHRQKVLWDLDYFKATRSCQQTS